MPEFLIVVGALIVIYIIVTLIVKAKAYDSIYKTLLSISNDVKKTKNKAFDYEMRHNNRTFLIKVIYNPSSDEICINAKHYWQKNHGVVSSRKKGDQMKGVYDLIFYDLEANGYPSDTVKLYVIYPESKRLMKVINECEMVFIKPDVDIYGSRVINYLTMKEDIDKL